jgi:glycine dehydrogenase subunit 1
MARSTILPPTPANWRSSASSAPWLGATWSPGDAPFFLGCGAYRHHIPASVDHLIQRGEYLTSYTPYQPEIAQGTLQALFEFQTQVARLYGCDVANASMYDGSTACWEAITMARRVTRRGKAILSAGLHPHYVSVARTMARFTGDVLDVVLPELTDGAPGDDMARLLAGIDRETSAVVVQYPNILGHIADLSELAERVHAAGALLIAVVTEPVALGLIRSPGEMGADIVVGEGQSIGVGLNFGGPYVGLFACKEKFVRQMPGRLCGETGRRRRHPWLRADAVDPRAAYPPREGDVQHLHQQRPVRARLLDPHDAAGREGAAAARRTQSRQGRRPRPSGWCSAGRGAGERTPSSTSSRCACRRKRARWCAPWRARLTWRRVARPPLPDAEALQNGLVVAVTETVTEQDVEALADALEESLA